jgi:hypothetical protein
VDVVGMQVGQEYAVQLADIRPQQLYPELGRRVDQQDTPAFL